MEKRYKEIDGVRYQVIQNTILGSNVVPVGESLPEVTVSDTGKVLTVNASGEWEAAAPGGGGGAVYYPLISNTHIEASYNDIKADLTAGKSVYIIQNQYMPDMAAYYMLTMEYQGGIAEAYAFDFIGYDRNASGIMVLSLGSLTADGDLYKPATP